MTLALFINVLIIIIIIIITMESCKHVFIVLIACRSIGTNFDDTERNIPYKLIAFDVNKDRQTHHTISGLSITYLLTDQFLAISRPMIVLYGITFQTTW